MGTTRIVNVDARGVAREIPGVGVVEHGQEVEVDSELAPSLLEQEGVWARPTTKAAKAAERSAK